MYEKAWCTCKVVVFLIKPIVFLTFSMPSASLDLKVPTIWQGTRSRRKNKIKYHCNISQNCVSKCTRLHLSACSFQNISAGGMPPDPSRNPGILLHLPKPTSHRQCANKNSSSTILEKELHMGNLTVACYENKRVLKVINRITMVTVLLWLLNYSSYKSMRWFCTNDRHWSSI